VTALEVLSTVMLAASLFFFSAGTIGLVRLPDPLSRLHALTKADNVGLGFVVLAVGLQAPSWPAAFKLLLIWLLVLAAATNVAFLIAGRVGREDAPPGDGGEP
jgi:multicomponent Na+:H+ antiporter subunit G